MKEKLPRTRSQIQKEINNLYTVRARYHPGSMKGMAVASQIRVLQRKLRETFKMGS